MFLMENSWFDNVSLDIEQTPTIIKVLDAGKTVVTVWHQQKASAISRKQAWEKQLHNHDTEKVAVFPYSCNNKRHDQIAVTFLAELQGHTK